MTHPRNVILLVTDDQRYDALGCMGNTIIRTPHLDRLAAEGTLFPNAFTTTPICPSSRASLFTGVHTRCHGVVDFATPLSDVMVRNSYPARLREAGYWTGFVGKYGVGRDLPEDAFDVLEAFAAQGDYFPYGEENGPHLTSILAGHAVDFLRERPADRPFCLSVSFKAPHGQKGDERKFVHDHAYDALYEDVEIPPPDKADREWFDRLPAFFQNAGARRGWEATLADPAQYQQMVKRYFRLITGVDDALGRIRAALAEEGIADDTAILFTSDHGFFLGERQLTGKWLLYEESIRVPLIAFDPRLDQKRRRARSDAMALNVDIAPTILTLAGLAAPGFVTGRDLTPLLCDSDAEWRSEAFFEHHYDPKGVHPPSEGMRLDHLQVGRWKYIRYVHVEPVVEELYDLGADAREHRNLAADPAYASALEHCRARWRSWSDELGRWQPAADYLWRDPD